MSLKTVGQTARVAVLLQAFFWISTCATEPAERTASEQATDDAVAARVKAALVRDPYLYVEHIDVTANRGVVRLSGVVAEADDLTNAVRVAKSVAGVKRVLNDLKLVDRR